MKFNQRGELMLKHEHLPKPKLTFGQKLSDDITRIGGSWSFIVWLIVILIIWMIINVVGVFGLHWDPYPFILLNLFLSCLAAFQAPIILMSQNRTAELDRHKAERDYAVNRKAEREVENMQSDLDEIKMLIRQHHQWIKESHKILHKHILKKKR